MGNRSKNAFSVEQSARQSHSVLFVRFKRVRRQRERRAKISNEDVTFSLTKKGGSFLILDDAGLSFFSTAARRKKKKICQRERETWQQKKERDFRFSLKRHTQIKHAPSQITTGVLSSLRFSTTLFCDTTFRFRDTKRQKKKRRVSFCSFFSRRGLHVFLVAS